MALTATLIEARPNSLAYSVVEANTAAATLTQNPLGDLVDGPLSTLLQPAGGFANQAAAVAAWNLAVDVLVHHSVTATAGATGGPTLVVIPNVSAPAVAGNFRVELSSVKAANGDTATYIVRYSFRHSIID